MVLLMLFTQQPNFQRSVPLDGRYPTVEQFALASGLSLSGSRKIEPVAVPVNG